METARLRNQFEESINRAIPEASILFQETERLPNVSVIAFPGVTSELLAFHLAQQDVFASFGGGRHQKLHDSLWYHRGWRRWIDPIDQRKTNL